MELKSSRGSVEVSAFEKISMRAEVGGVEIDTCTDFEVTCAQGDIKLFAPGEIKIESLSEINLEAPTINITASESIVLKVGASEIRISAEDRCEGPDDLEHGDDDQHGRREDRPAQLNASSA